MRRWCASLISTALAPGLRPSTARASSGVIAVAGVGRPVVAPPTAAPFRPTLAQSPVTFGQPFGPAVRSQPAKTLLSQDPRAALPRLRLAESDSGPFWLPLFDLLSSGPDDRVFVAVIPQADPDRPGVVACELGLAPENLDEYRTRIDGNARRGPRVYSMKASSRFSSITSIRLGPSDSIAARCAGP